MTICGLLATVSAVSLVACQKSQYHIVGKNPNTGDPQFEKQVAPNPIQPVAGQVGYVAPQRIVGTGTPSPNASPTNDDSQPDQTIVLQKGTQVQVVGPAQDGMTEVTVIGGPNCSCQRPRQNPAQNPSSAPPPQAPAQSQAQTVLVPTAYINQTPVADTPEEAAAKRFFMVQNLATKKLRVYEACRDKEADGVTCLPRLILQTDMADGRDTLDERSILGDFRISSWFKFYQDKEDLYPSWYNPSYPAIPLQGATSTIEAWMSKSLLPDGKGSERGAFGWYTAQLVPNAKEQWVHGSQGWASDGTRFSVLPTHGCSRVDNPTIAFLREILPSGTEVVKIYAHESLADSSLARYQKIERIDWSWVLTQDSVNAENGAKDGEKDVNARNVPSEQRMENGVYTSDQMPRSATGNGYRLPESSFKGTFLVDEGRVVGYEHPKEMAVGGYPDHTIPQIMLKK
jgi:hypothetical protein